MDFDSQLYFPSDWETVEGQYTDAGALPFSSDSEKNAKIAAFASVTDAYNNLFNKSVPLYAQAREDEIMDVRNNITELADINNFPEYIGKVDDTALTALAQYEDGDYYGAKDSAAAAFAEYKILLAGAKVYSVRMEIADRGFEVYDSENLKNTDELALQALDEYNKGQKDTAVTKASEAELRYVLILKTCWVKYAAEREKSAASERKRAVDNKVNVAVRDLFRDADVIYTQASDDFKVENYPSAAILFTEAEARFAFAGRETEEKRMRAEDAIKMADEKIIISEENAIRVERFLDGGSR
jgi:hypothetical protein